MGKLIVFGMFIMFGFQAMFGDALVIQETVTNLFFLGAGIVVFIFALGIFKEASKG